VTTVTTLAALTTAVAGDTAKIVKISGIYSSPSLHISRILTLTGTAGTITGNVVVKVGSNTSVIGLAGSCEHFWAYFNLV